MGRPQALPQLLLRKGKSFTLRAGPFVFRWGAGEAGLRTGMAQEAEFCVNLQNI